MNLRPSNDSDESEDDKIPFRTAPGVAASNLPIVIGALFVMLAPSCSALAWLLLHALD